MKENFEPKPRAKAIVTGLSLYPKQLQKLDYLVTQTGMSRSALVQQMIEHTYLSYTYGEPEDQQKKQEAAMRGESNG